MAFAPWAQQVRGARYGEPPPAEPPKPPISPPVDYSKKEYGWPWQKSWWEEPWRGLFETTPEGERGAAIPANWIRDIGIGLTGGAALTGLAGAGAGLATMGKALPWGIRFPFTHPWLAGLGMTGAGALLGGGEPTPELPVAPVAPITPTAPTTPTLPQPGEGMGEPTGPIGQPQIIEVGGQTFWWNPTGGIYGAGGWDLIPARTTPALQLTPEQQIQQSEAERAAAMARLQEQYRLEQLQMEQQSRLQRQMQEAQAAQQMAQMYAADPYKYWAQMGQGTPGAVARLTGGQIAPGQQMGKVPLSTPSAQWWSNLLPSEQQQISGGLNWLGVNPEDWYSMYSRMIPGLGSRQVEPQWSR